MASTTPAVPGIHRGHSTVIDSPLQTKVLCIAVGPEKSVFNVHEGKLSQTKFFEVEGPPAVISEQTAISDIQYEETREAHVGNDDSNSQLKTEQGDHSDTQLGSDAKATDVDYHLKDRFIHKSEAFKIFIGYLYNKDPTVPKDDGECRTLLRAYGTAWRYACVGLQNAIIEQLRQYHTKVPVKLDDLTWIVNRLGRDVECPMSAYLVEQIAWDIASDGLEQFNDENQFTKTFIVSGDRAVRFELFKALARLAKDTKQTDPATGMNRWKLPDSPII